MKCNLLLHCGADAVERSQLKSVNTPLATDTWQPIPHNELLYQVETSLCRNGLTVVEQAHALTHDGSRYFGLLQVQNGSQHPDYSWVLGIRNSHDKQFPAGIVAGSSVFVCDNLAFSGEISVARKHTSRIMRDLPELIGNAVTRLLDKWHIQDQRISAYQNVWLSDRTVHDLTINALDHDVICASKIPKLLAEYREPQHQAFRPRNLWSWFNAVTETLKGNLTVLPARTQRLHHLCDQYAGVAA